MTSGTAMPVDACLYQAVTDHARRQGLPAEEALAGLVLAGLAHTYGAPEAHRMIAPPPPGTAAGERRADEAGQPVDLTVTVRDYGGHALGTGTITAAGTCPDGRCDPRKAVGVGTVDVRLQMQNGRWHQVGTYAPHRDDGDPEPGEP